MLDIDQLPFCVIMKLGTVGVHKQAKKIEGHTSQPDRISCVSTEFVIRHT